MARANIRAVIRWSQPWEQSLLPDPRYAPEEVKRENKPHFASPSLLDTLCCALQANCIKAHQDPRGVTATVGHETVSNACGTTCWLRSEPRDPMQRTLRRRNADICQTTRTGQMRKKCMDWSQQSPPHGLTGQSHRAYSHANEDAYW